MARSEYRPTAQCTHIPLRIAPWTLQNPSNHGADRAEVARRHYRHACATKPRSVQRLTSRGSGDIHQRR